jgi:hypothetical protein
MAGLNIDFVGQLPEGQPAGDEDREDYRPVPESDASPGYRDQGMLGSYRTSAKQYPNPPGVKLFAGFGATEEDLERGFCEPRISDDPAYQLDDYKHRSSQPALSDIDEGGAAATSKDYAFRRKNERSRGFLTRPHIPTDR